MLVHSKHLVKTEVWDWDLYVISYKVAYVVISQYQILKMEMMDLNYLVICISKVCSITLLSKLNWCFLFRYFILDSGVLYITKVQPGDAGTYR
jgi:hypothetical protein